MDRVELHADQRVVEEQNLDERGDLAGRIEEDELEAALGNQKPKKY